MRQKMKLNKGAPTKFERAEIPPERKGIEEEAKKKEEGIKRAELPKEEAKTTETKPIEPQQKTEKEQVEEKDENEIRYSDIDTEFENKMKSNPIEDNEEDDESNEQSKRFNYLLLKLSIRKRTIFEG